MVPLDLTEFEVRDWIDDEAISQAVCDLVEGEYRLFLFSFDFHPLPPLW